MSNLADSETKPPAVERLAFTIEETCKALGGISRVTLWRLEALNRIRSIDTGMRLKLFSRGEIERFLSQTRGAA